MFISSVVIRNFRNFRSVKCFFKDGINTIIGENGSGKTNLFYAIRIILDEAFPRNFKFSESDFNRSLPSWIGHWIIITIQFDDLHPSEEAQVLAVQSCGQIDTNSKGCISVFFRPKYQLRKELFDYSKTSTKNEEGLKLLLDKYSIDDYETVYLSRGTGDFSDEDIYRKYIGDFENINFADPDNKEELIFGVWMPREINIHNEISCTFIKALRDVESDLRSYANNPLISLFRGKEKTVEISKQEGIIDAINELNTKIVDLDEVKEIKDGIDKSIKQAVGTTYSPNIDLRSELPNEMEKLFQSLKIWVGDPDESGYMGRLWELSLGGANLIYLSLKLLEYEKVKTDRVANILLIEEPEAHIHTHIQKTLFSNLKDSKTQVFVSTHSTHVSSVSQISRMNILSRGSREALVFQPSNKLSSDEILHIERYLDAIRGNLLFAKSVILVEGDAEQIVIPELVKKVFGITLDEIGVSLVNIGSTGFENIAKIFNQDRIMKRCAIITDGDKSIIKLPDDPTTDDDFQKHCRESERNGKDREKRLNTFSKGNIYLESFYSDYTFEVDFLLNKNSYEYVNCLDTIYDRSSDIEKSKLKLENDDVSVAGVEVLRLATKLGKGWLALLVSNYLNYNSYLPKYIMDALLFVSNHINIQTKIKAIRYRIKSIRNNEKDNKDAREFKFQNRTEEEIIKSFCTIFPEDQFASFLGSL